MNLTDIKDMNIEERVIPNRTSTLEECFANLSSGELTLSDWLALMYHYGRNCRGLPIEGLVLVDNTSGRKNGKNRVPYSIAGKKQIVEEILTGNGSVSEFSRERFTLDTEYDCLAVFLRNDSLAENQIENFLNLIQSYYSRYEIYRRSIECWGPEQAVILIGAHPRFLRILDDIQKCAKSNHPVLITGETGTGKELFARALYLLKNNTGPFIPINCGCMNPQMAYSHLFGHQKGSYTGAQEKRAGVFRAAEGGTLFLDEVEALSPDLQAMLLRVLDYGEITPLGSDYPEKVHTSIIAASNQNLEDLVRTGQFRRDLFYRLRTHQVALPELKHRGKSDIKEIAWYFLSLENANHRINKYFDKNTFQKIVGYHWPGNIRELKNVVIDTVFKIGDKQKIKPHHIQLDDVRSNSVINKADVQNDITKQIFFKLINRQADFWEIVYQPYQQKDLNREQVKKIIEMGVNEYGKNDLRDVSRKLGISTEEWRKFYLFINRTIYK